MYMIHHICICRLIYLPFGFFLIWVLNLGYDLGSGFWSCIWVLIASVGNEFWIWFLVASVPDVCILLTPKGVLLLTNIKTMVLILI